MESSDLWEHLISFGLGVIATIIGIIVTDRLTTKRELTSFYGTIAALLDQLIAKEDPDRVRQELTNPEIHYTFNKLWVRIPTNRRGIKIRATIFEFIKGGDNLQGLASSKSVHQLYEWLKKT